MVAQHLLKFGIGIRCGQGFIAGLLMQMWEVVHPQYFFKCLRALERHPHAIPVRTLLRFARADLATALGREGLPYRAFGTWGGMARLLCAESPLR